MCRVLIICTDRFFAKKAKETLVIGDDIQSFQAPLRKGSSAEGGEGLFFATLQPLRGFRAPLGDACKRASHTCKSLSHKGGLIKINSRRSRTASLRFSLFFFISKSRPERRLFSAHLFTATRCLLRAFRPLRVFRLLSARH